MMKNIALVLSVVAFGVLFFNLGYVLEGSRFAAEIAETSYGVWGPLGVLVLGLITFAGLRHNERVNRRDEYMRKWCQQLDTFDNEEIQVRHHMEKLVDALDQGYIYDGPFLLQEIRVSRGGTAPSVQDHHQWLRGMFKAAIKARVESGEWKLRETTGTRRKLIETYAF